ncbi:putative tricarboxylic transport membrane protein [Geopseudomonas sagittaria]|uniref:Putative tricarboxylic transport membrane protein n=1 Tax=Geopseudomonas sagittaria TaxID=1135990 RepID=A0A1I5XRE6_9GAMM|nr:tripartite tricarboxylate transporter TctB family protein [Pseudomonas sagittaria]MCM2330178.1 tripartite tricarboxylate transporter TctB family protein [Pseudomonas sagittaria]SFQ34513.1 putative tricarboxylic transport membrane protein [Pseudomonas sagittaria]
MYDRLFGSVWLLLCAGLAVIAWGFQPPFSYDPVGPRAYPLLLLGLLGAGALWLVIRPALHKHLLGATQSLRALLCIAGLLAFALLFEPLGFVPATALAATGLGLLFGGRPLPCALSGVLMGVLLYVLFDLLLDVPLPLGVFEFLVE